MKKILLKSKIFNAFISFGESSVLALGKHPYGDFWRVGIKDLFHDRKNAYVFDLLDGSVSTSGNSPNNEGKYPDGHVIDPDQATKSRGISLDVRCRPRPC